MKPVVFLDVDGVINDLSAIFDGPVGRQYDCTVFESHGFVLYVPEFMPKLVQSMVATCDVYWLTTWREKANDEIATVLGIDSLPVLTDGTEDGHVDWKPAAAFDIADAAIKDGRPVVWIEDFYGDIPVGEMPAGVVFVDTAVKANNPVLLPAMVPDFLLSVPKPEPLGRFGEPTAKRGNVFGSQRKTPAPGG